MEWKKLTTVHCSLTTVFRGVSSTVKLSVSKTELGGANPSAPARLNWYAWGENAGREGLDVWQRRRHYRRAMIVPPARRRQELCSTFRATRLVRGRSLHDFCPMSVQRRATWLY